MYKDEDVNMCVIGLGYVGLPTATIFANSGFRIIGVDINEFKVSMITRGKPYIKEPGLDNLFRKAVSEGRLTATSSVEEALDSCIIVLIDVPSSVNGGVVDLSYVVNISQAVARKLREDMLVVIESTVPPGTTSGLIRNILEKGSGLKVEEDFYLAHVPERIAPGRAIEELLHAPRVVGGVGPRSTEKALEVYGRVNPNLLPTDATTAEFVKLIENTFRDLNIAFANLIALIAERFGIDVYEAIRLANTHPRVNIHWPGAGVGGPCLTKDPYMLASLLPDFWGVELIRMSRRINEFMPYHMVEIVEKAAGLEGLDLSLSKVAILGAAYKGGVDDTRESPARVVVVELAKKFKEVVVHDPYTRESFGAKYSENLEEAVKDADAIVVVTDHPEFKHLDLDKLGRLVRRRIIVDGRGVFEPSKAISAGFRYYGVGYGRAWRA
ncbi:nucleotide sugar dehydrogenase [Saccharolobus sp.]|uniref:nucleotide sugar dehydrogenase n=1 Tax=Saccharolobus sp. TaxID=2100761 RepID=UPI00316BDF10